MTVYEPGTVAVATVRGVPNVRVMSYTFEDVVGWASATEAGGEVDHADHVVTDVRPLVVLDHSHIGDALAALQNILSSDRVMLTDHVYALHELAQQIEAQTKPPRIPEPGLWGVVEAGHKHLGPERRSEFVRVYTEGVVQWVDRSSEADWCLWNDLIDPTLIRDGIEDGAK